MTFLRLDKKIFCYFLGCKYNVYVNKTQINFRIECKKNICRKVANLQQVNFQI